MVSHDSFFNSISPPPLSVIDNWCGPTSLSGDVEFLTENHRVACYCCAFILEVRLAVFSLLSQVMTWHWRDPQGAKAPGKKKQKNPIGCFSQFKMLSNAQNSGILPCATQYCLHALVSVKLCRLRLLFCFHDFVFDRRANCKIVLWIGNPGWALQSLVQN